MRHSMLAADVPAVDARPTAYMSTRTLKQYKYKVDGRCVTSKTEMAAPACEGVEHAWGERCASGGAS